MENKKIEELSKELKEKDKKYQQIKKERNYLLYALVIVVLVAIWNGNKTENQPTETKKVNDNDAPVYNPPVYAPSPDYQSNYDPVEEYKKRQAEYKQQQMEEELQRIQRNQEEMKREQEDREFRQKYNIYPYDNDW